MDRLLRWVRDIKQATFFDIQNVADYYFAYRSEDEWNTARDFTVAPPFDFFAMKYRLPESYPEEWRGLDILNVFRVVDRPPVTSLTILTEGVEINPYPPALVAGARWHLVCQTFSAEKNTVIPPVDWFLAVDERGQFARHRGHLAMWLTDTHNPYNAVGLIADTFIQIAFLALTFLHCKNVEVLSPPPPSKKRLPRKRKFETRYHRLKINAIGQKGEPQPGRKTGITQGLHIVRGHFREYGEEFGKGKLFGKYAGRFWVAAHMSGNLEAGAITKDYQVEAPKE